MPQSGRFVGLASRFGLSLLAAGITVCLVAIDPELDALRRAIDDVERRLLALIAERVNIVLKVGDYKRQRSLSIYDPERERIMIEQLIKLAPQPLNPEIVRRVFERVIDESRRIEQHHSEYPHRSP
jgi:chorismate mutase